MVFLSQPISTLGTMGEMIDTTIGVTVFLVIVGSAIGWLMNVFTGSGSSHSDFDTKDTADFY